MEYVFVDLESFYSKEFTLKKLDPPSYILDPRFEAHCMGVARGLTAPPFLVDGPDIPKYLKTLPDDVAMVSHNALFDMCILSWIYGYVPKLIVDTLAMARTLLQHKLKSLSLAKVAEHFGLLKGDMLHHVIGMTRLDIIAAGLWQQYGAYCCNDVALCRAIFLRLLPLIPPEELVVHDMVARCAVEPVFRLNSDILAENLDTVQSYKDLVFAKAMFAGLEDISQLMSNERFAQLLISLDVHPPMKVSKTTGKATYAFARSDPGFLMLQDHEDLRVAALVEARLAWKSTLEETRTERMLNIGQLEFPICGTGMMPVPLIVGAAITHRLGGGWKLNCQNWGRKSQIRRAIEAPPGHKVVTADSRQIEARMNAWFCGQLDLLDEFRRGEDVYANFASSIYHYLITAEEYPRQRFVGKTGILQLGYQAWWPRFQASVYILSYEDEDGPVELTDDEAREVVTGYRRKYRAISGMWKYLPQYFQTIAGYGAPAEHYPLIIEKGRVIGPNGLCLYYDDLRYNDETDEWTYSYHGYRFKLYGGKFLENIIQFLSRIATFQSALRLRKPLAEYSSSLKHTSHDELVYVVPDEYVEPVKTLLRTEMKRSPDWAPNLPLDVSIGTGQSYADAK